eukprot:m.160248 g.160248  ORF g.160248 m.160248 type:complete len:325 (-) comp11920_c0_seq1:227-1201(-)
MKAPPTLSMMRSTLTNATGGGAHKGSPAGKASRKAKLKTNTDRRQQNRWNDDVAVCPMCLAHPWGRGRISNCRDHIERCQCAVRLTKLYTTVDANGVAVPAVGLWTQPDGRATVAAMNFGQGRRSRRLYWAPTTFASTHAAELEWNALVACAPAGGSLAKGDAALATANRYPLWCSEMYFDYTDEQGVVPLHHVVDGPPPPQMMDAAPLQQLVAAMAPPPPLPDILHPHPQPVALPPIDDWLNIPPASPPLDVADQFTQSFELDAAYNNNDVMGMLDDGFGAQLDPWMDVAAAAIPFVHIDPPQLAFGFADDDDVSAELGAQGR